GANSPVAPGLTKVLFLFFQPKLRGHIEKACNTESGVEYKPAQAYRCAMACKLTAAVGEYQHIVQIVEYVGDPPVHHIRCHFSIALGHGAQEMFVQCFIENEDLAVEPLPWVCICPIHLLLGLYR